MAARTGPKKSVSLLGEAIEHVSVCGASDSDYGNYVVIRNGQVIGNDGLLSAGATAPVAETFAPELDTFRKALARAGDRYALALIPPNVVLTSNAGRFPVPCRDVGTIPGVGPDQGFYSVSERDLAALSEAAMVTTEKAERYVCSAVWCSGQYVFGTNGNDTIRAYTDLICPDVEIPKEFIIAIKKVKDRKLTHIGFGQDSVTAWFGNDRWIRCKRRRDIDHTMIVVQQSFDLCLDHLDGPSYNLLDGLAYQLEVLKPFVVNDNLYLVGAGLMTQKDSSAASVQFAHGLPAGRYRFSALQRAALFGMQVRFNDTQRYGGDDTVMAWRGHTMVGVSTMRKIDAL